MKPAPLQQAELHYHKQAPMEKERASWQTQRSAAALLHPRRMVGVVKRSGEQAGACGGSGGWAGTQSKAARQADGQGGGAGGEPQLVASKPKVHSA